MGIHDAVVPEPLRLQTGGPDETRGVGEVIGRNARAGDIFLLTGPLGAGKTCLTQGIASGLGVEGYVRSPTFVLMTRHRGRLTLHHIDLYRIGGPAEAWDLGLEEELSGDGVCVVEWADRAGDVLDTEALWLDLAYGAPEDERIIEISRGPERYRPLLDALACHPSARGRQPAGET